MPGLARGNAPAKTTDVSRRGAAAQRRRFHAASFRPPPELEGLPLATPRRRIAAFVIDVLLVFLPSILVGFSASAAAMAVREPAAFDAFRTLITRSRDGSAERVRLLGQVAPLLVRGDATGVPPAVAVAVDEGDLTRAGEILSGYDFSFAIGDGGTLAPNTIRVHMDRFIPDPVRNIALFGVAAAYFTFLTAASRRTIGKRLMRMRVVTIHGRPLTYWQSFERFGGYFASLGTFGLGLRDLSREPNRRLAHDRLADTVVLDVAGGRR